MFAFSADRSKITLQPNDRFALSLSFCFTSPSIPNQYRWGNKSAPSNMLGNMPGFPGEVQSQLTHAKHPLNWRACWNPRTMGSCARKSFREQPTKINVPSSEKSTTTNWINLEPYFQYNPLIETNWKDKSSSVLLTSRWILICCKDGRMIVWHSPLSAT